MAAKKRKKRKKRNLKNLFCGAGFQPAPQVFQAAGSGFGGAALLFNPRSSAFIRGFIFFIALAD